MTECESAPCSSPRFKWNSSRRTDTNDAAALKAFADMFMNIEALVAIAYDWERLDGASRLVSSSSLRPDVRHQPTSTRASLRVSWRLIAAALLSTRPNRGGMLFALRELVASRPTETRPSRPPKN